jgi:hypothetical protein
LFGLSGKRRLIVYLFFWLFLRDRQ